MASPDTYSLSEATRLIASTPAPVLLIDTCSLLDVIRYPLRGRDYVVEAAVLLAEQASTDPKRLHLVITSTIEDEWVNHLHEECRDVEKSLLVARQTIEALSAACMRAGLTPPPPLSPDYDVVPLLLGDMASQLHDGAIRLANDADCIVRASERLSKRLRPARKGGQINDCLIVEHLLALGALLRSASFTEKLLFVSSNTKDYCDTGATLHPDLASEFGALSLMFVTDLKRAQTRLEE